MIINAEYSLANVGDIFPYDSVILIIIDTILYIKLTGFIILKIHSDPSSGFHHIPDIVFAFLSMIYTLSIMYLYIILHVNTVSSTGMSVTAPMGWTLFNAITHPFISSYSSMMAQGRISIRYLSNLVKALLQWIVLCGEMKHVSSN